MRDTGQNEDVTRFPRELKSLTSLRGIAALAVVLQHFSATAQSYSRVVIPSLVPHGYVAVDFFFVLSGFIMAYTYLKSFQEGGSRAFGPFIVKRVARIVPLNLAVLAAIAVAGAISALALGHNIFFATPTPVFDFVANILMLQGVGIGHNLNGPSWSISVEFVAYFFFPVFAFLIFRRRHVAVAAIAVAIFAVGALASQQPRFGLAYDEPPGSVLRCFSEFTFGLASYRMYRSPKMRCFLGKDLVVIGLSLFVTFALVARCDLAAVFVFPFIVVAYAVNDGAPARVVQLRPLYFLGVISFSLYLLHNLFRPLDLALLQWAAGAPVGGVSALVFAFIGSCGVIPFSWIAYEAVERPGRKFVRKILRRGISSQPSTLA